jgi:SpoVK/Ycf46/Vps4 family AAA+-type ATPase
VSEASGVLLIITTNRPETLDPALGRAGGVSRPGRIDRVVEFGPLDEAGREHIAARILTGYPDAISKCVLQGTGDTGAQFEDRCVREAMRLYWTASTKPETTSAIQHPEELR